MRLKWVWLPIAAVVIAGMLSSCDETADNTGSSITSNDDDEPDDEAADDSFLACDHFRNVAYDVSHGLLTNDL
jgi:hypothetical protein